MSPLLQVSDLRVRFEQRGGRDVHAVAGLSYELEQGTTLAIIGPAWLGFTAATLAKLTYLQSAIQPLDVLRVPELLPLLPGMFGTGLLVALVFAAPPLVRARHYPAMALMRSRVAPLARAWRGAVWPAWRTRCAPRRPTVPAG